MGAILSRPHCVNTDWSSSLGYLLLLVSQRLPVYPTAHVQVYVASTDIHVALFMQGVLSQGSKPIWNKR